MSYEAQLAGSSTVWADSAVVPVYVAALSCVVFALQASWRISSNEHKGDNDAVICVHSQETAPMTLHAKALRYAAALGGLPTARLNLLRFTTALVLLGSQVYTTILYGRTWMNTTLTITYVRNART